MKYLLCLFSILILSIEISNAQYIAHDFTLNNCDGNSCNLFNLVDEGNIVVLIYEHQCSSCLQGATNVKNVISNNYSNNTNIKVLYLDNGGYTCQQTQNWISSHNLIPGQSFEYSNDFNSPYGSGMPVIVIVSGVSHETFLVANGYSDTTSIKNALISALQAVPASVTENTISKYKVFSNANTINIEGLNSNILNIVEVIDLSGRIVFSKETVSSSISIPVKFEEGIYFVRINKEFAEKICVFKMQSI